mgnify:CR=1 FL=1
MKSPFSSLNVSGETIRCRRRIQRRRRGSSQSSSQCSPSDVDWEKCLVQVRRFFHFHPVVPQ